LRKVPVVAVVGAVVIVLTVLIVGVVNGVDRVVTVEADDVVTVLVAAVLTVDADSEVNVVGVAVLSVAHDIPKHTITQKASYISCSYVDISAVNFCLYGTSTQALM